MNVKLGNISAHDAYYPYAAVSRHDPSPLDDLSDGEVVERAKDAGVSTELWVGGELVGPADRATVQSRLEAVVAYRPLPGNRVTELGINETNLADALRTITVGLWPACSPEPPSWVESDSQGLALVLAEYYNCPVGRPDDWEGLEVGGGPLAPAAIDPLSVAEEDE